MSANAAASDSAYPSPGPSTARWWQNEDWLAVLAALPILIAVAKGWGPKMPSMSWTGAADAAKAFSADNLALSGVLLAVFLGISVLALGASLGKRVLSFLGGAVVVFVLAWLAQWIAGHAGIKAWGLEYVVFALGLGMLWSHTLPVPEWLREAVRTEFFIKVGIVLLGASILLQEMMKAGLPGLIQGALVIPVVWYACFLIARKLKVDDEFGVMLSTAVSICGVSAAIAETTVRLRRPMTDWRRERAGFMAFPDSSGKAARCPVHIRVTSRLTAPPSRSRGRARDATRSRRVRTC